MIYLDAIVLLGLGCALCDVMEGDDIGLLIVLLPTLIAQVVVITWRLLA